LVPRGYLELGVWWFRTELQVGVSQRVTNSVDTNMESSIQEVLVFKITLTSRVYLSPFGVGSILRKKIFRGQFVLGETILREFIGLEVYLLEIFIAQRFIRTSIFRRGGLYWFRDRH
jgi:hypothetical protein